MQRRIAVLMGGVSSEREVSLKSGKAIAAALRQRGHDVLEVDIVAEDVSAVQALNPDVAFIALHGEFGEDGGVQALLEQAGIPYTGSDVQASRSGMNKMASKCYFITYDIPTPPFRLVAARESHGVSHEIVNGLGLPLVVKPLVQGSSIGVSVVERRAELRPALDKAFACGTHAILERCIRGREITVGILDDRALPIIELQFDDQLFSYDAKYASKTTRFITAPDLDPEFYTRIQEIALAAHRVLGCRHFSRVDMMLESDGCPYVLEVNTIPGFTQRSLLPLAASKAGIEFPELCERIVEMALVDQSVPQVGVSGM